MAIYIDENLKQLKLWSFKWVSQIFKTFNLQNSDKSQAVIFETRQILDCKFILKKNLPEGIKSKIYREISSFIYAFWYLNETKSV